MIFPSGSGHPGAAGGCRTPYRKQPPKSRNSRPTPSYTAPSLVS